MDIENFRKQVQKLKNNKDLYQQELAAVKIEKKKEMRYLRDLESSRTLIQEAANETQQHLEYHLSHIVSTALETVFPEDPYKFKIKFVSRRNSTETDLVFSKDGKEMKPLESCGYGAADVASLALRLAYWKLGTSANTILMDEPMRFLDKSKQALAGEMIKNLSKQLKLQIIMVTHEEELIGSADKVFEVFQQNGVSKVKEL